MKRLSMCMIFCSLAIFCNPCPSQAEVLNLTIKWSGLLCETTCIHQLQNQFQKIPGIQSFVISGPAGQINAVWKPNILFSFPPINTAMSNLGLTINDIRVKVRGKLQHDAHSVTLVSDTDHTRFNLLNPVLPQMHGQAAEFNLGARGLTPALRQKLLDAEADKLTVTIEGLLFMPERSPPLYLVVEQFSSKKEKN